MPPPALTAAGLLVSLFSTDWPPERYTGDAVATIAFLTPAEVAIVCSRAIPPGSGIVRACTRANHGHPFIVAPRPGSVPDEELARLLAHELAHARGWSREHER